VARLLAPRPATDDAEEEELTKNNSSVILHLSLKIAGETKARYLLCGDAEVAIWEKIWKHHKSTPERLRYDVLIAPHHCSWHSLSWDSWSDFGESARLSADARNALGQAQKGAFIIASSKAIKDDKDDPPCIRAKREYLAIVRGVSGQFICLCEGGQTEPLTLTIGEPKKPENLLRPATAAAGAFTFPNRPVAPDKPGGFA
jgi:hypothetical protein